MTQRTMRLIIVLAVFSMTALTSAIASTSAFAFVLSQLACEAGTWTNLCWAESSTSPLLELEGNIPLEALLISGENLELLAKLGGEDLNILCTDAHAQATVVQNHPLMEDGTIEVSATPFLEFNGCKITGTLGEKCTTPEMNLTTELIGTPSLTELGDIVFAPKAGETTEFLTIEIKQLSKCPTTLIGKHKLTGFQLCTLLRAGEDIETHELECALESGLLLGEALAEAHNLNMNVLIANAGTVEEKYWDLVNVS